MILAPLALPLLVLLAFFVCLALQQTISAWLRVLLANVFSFQPTKSKSGGFLKTLTGALFLGPALILSSPAAKLITWPIHKVVTAVETAVNSALGHYAGAQLHAVTKWFDSLAWIALHTAQAIGDGTAATWDALRILRETTIPGLIKAAVNPVAKVATNAFNLAKATDAMLDDVTADFGKALSVAGFGAWTTLHNQLIGFAHAMDNLHGEVWGNIRPDVAALKAQVYNTIAVQIGNLVHTTAVVIPGQISDLRDRVRGVEEAIAGLLDYVPPIPGDITSIPQTLLDKLKALADPLVFAGAAVAAITAFAPQLFCRNSLRTASKLCSLDDDLLDDLLLDVALIGGIISLAEIIGFAEELLPPVVSALEEIAD